MNKNHELVIKTVASIIVFVFILTACYFSYRFLRCFGDAKELPRIPAYDMMHFTVFGSSGDTVSGRFTLYDTSGKEIAEIERSWNAPSLSITFTAACFDDRLFVFPYKIYGSENKNIWNGTSLEPYYMEHGLCLLLSEWSSKKQKRALYHLGVFALAKSVSYFTKFARQYTIDLSTCDSGREYMIVVQQTGTPYLEPVDN